MNSVSSELIPIAPRAINGSTVQTVNARELHEFLEVETRFNDWMVRRIEEYEFQDDRDFCSFLSKSFGGRPAKE